LINAVGPQLKQHIAEAGWAHWEGSESVLTGHPAPRAVAAPQHGTMTRTCDAGVVPTMASRPRCCMTEPIFWPRRR